ncbi:MAG: alpha-L-fucosidase [Verrucomicrobia bacterium]|nr:alpha-L-fucosidase [Verrucomicrobiota bacterium]
MALLRRPPDRHAGGKPAAMPDSAPPLPCGALPSARQLRWHRLEAYAFVHFTVNTFTGREWGYGDESPACFAPTDCDVDGIVRDIGAAGLRGLILTAKHHDGFCLWPSQFTAHSLRHSPYRGGRGDLVREFADACGRHGVAFGVYLSPWDRHHAAYGQPAYVTYFRAQLRELLTAYGPIFEVWFDGANGGDGYYGGARERRQIAEDYYDWPRTHQLVRELQPDAVIFSATGPDVRWVGNEDGVAGSPCWPTITGDEEAVRRGDFAVLNSGTPRGAVWRPAEADVSIRPGWFHHDHEDRAVKTPDQLMDLFFASVGRGAALNLNLPPDRRGRLADPDRAALAAWGERRRALFARNLAAGATVTASDTRGNAARYGAANLLDGSPDTYWATNDPVRHAELMVEFAQPEGVEVLQLREFLPLGCRIESFALDAWRDGGWSELALGSAVGSNCLLRFPRLITPRVRVRLLKAAACPVLSALGLYRSGPA